MRYFEGLIDEEAIKARYKELAKKFHPDLGGCTETMKEINNQYAKVLEGAYQKEGKSITEIEELLAKDAKLREKMSQIIQYEGIEIELCGRWLWVTGATKEIKHILKEAGFWWANQKKAWYWHLPEDKCKHSRGLDLDKIRENYGSQKLNGNQHFRIA